MSTPSIDIGLAMGLGQPLRFSRDEDISWSPQIATGRPAARFTELSAALALHSRPDPRLLNVWADLREFSARVNDTVARGAKVPMDIASRLATSVPHQLLRLRVDEGLVGEGAACGGLLHELLRLCMLAYAKTLLIKLPGIGRKMVVLVEGLRGSLTAWHCDLRLRAVGGGVSGEDVLEGARRLLLWAVFVASVAIFEESDEDWLHDILVTDRHGAWITGLGRGEGGVKGVLVDRHCVRPAWGALISPVLFGGKGRRNRSLCDVKLKPSTLAWSWMHDSRVAQGSFLLTTRHQTLCNVRHLVTT